MKKYKYIDSFPKPFLNDLVNDKVLPFIGAGFSKNAEIPKNKKMLDWDELGKEFANDIQDYKYSNAIDAISAYCHEYSRTSLVEKLTKILLVNSAKPGNTHKAFCDLQFDIVCTTNFEFLLESGYSLLSKFCQPILDEDQLAISNSQEGVTLLKLHGDLNHPMRLVATEEDYDRFLNKNPMLATFLANLLITRTALFIGYSLDDTDFRQIWQLIKDRLGKLRRQAYVLKIDCSSHEKARYERRGVRVINIKGNPKDYPQILEDVFKELKDYWNQEVLKQPIVSEDETIAELSLPEGANNRLCFFSVPFKQLPFYKKYIFPIVISQGLVPISADEIITSGDNWLAKVTALIKRSEFFVVDLASKNTIFELGLAMNSKESLSKILIINEEGLLIPSSFAGVRYITRSQDPFENSDFIVSEITHWLNTILEPMRTAYEDEPKRLLAKKEYRAAAISAISLLEIHLRRRLENLGVRTSKPSTFINLFDSAISHQLITADRMSEVKKWLYLRNKAVHSKETVNAKEAKDIVNGVYEIIGTL